MVFLLIIQLVCDYSEEFCYFLSFLFKGGGKNTTSHTCAVFCSTAWQLSAL